MAQIFRIHPVNPQPRLIKQVVGLLCEGKVIIYPTDSCYALGCQIGYKVAQERIRRIREVNLRRHNFTLVCRDLSELAIYSIVDNPAYRLIKTLTPGPYTFILKATREVPRRLQDPRRKTIGLRVPDNRIALAILEALGEPIMSSTLLLPGEDAVPTDPEFIYERFGKQVDLVIDGGNCGFEPTTVVDLTEGMPQVIRQGKGDISLFE
jgi:tRNA threonylcarbamoyl adenosine modification protein (Sua5/YciO/YrdC/YwlC family)